MRLNTNILLFLCADRQSFNFSCWILITPCISQALKGSLKTKETCLISLEDNNQINVRTYQRGIKQHLYDHQNEESATKYDCEALLKLANDGNKSRGTNTKDCKTKQRNNLKEKELSHIDLLRRLKIKHGNKLTELWNECRRMSSDIMSRWENINRATKK